MNADTSTRDFLSSVAIKINKKPEDIEKFICILEENWIETVDGLK